MNNSPQAMTEAGIIYQCPRCQGSIKKNKNCWYCENCGQKFEVRRNIAILDVNLGDKPNIKPIYKSSPASGSITVDNPDEFLDTVEERGWRPALENLWGVDSAGLLRAIASNRVAWKYLLNIDSSWKALDIGGGTGGVACQLAKECGVVTLDKSWCDAAFAYIRAQQEGISQFEASVGDAVSLPFKPKQFNLVTLIGSLEWVPTSWPSKKPRQVQLKALQEAYRVLKPGGSLYLAIENRLYLGYFLGLPEPHTNLPYISVMDREKAEILSQDFRGCSYLEMTHSKDEYIELLKEAGFSKIEAFWLHPDYSTPSYIVPLDNPEIIKFFIEERLNPWNFTGVRTPVYKFYRLLDPATISNYVEFYGFLARR